MGRREKADSRSAKDSPSYSGYPMGQPNRVTAKNNTIEDRPGNDPHIRDRRTRR